MKARTVEELRRKLRNSTQINWSATADRFDVIVDCMTNLYVAETISVDRDAAKRIADFCRRSAEGHKFSNKEVIRREEEMIDFLRAHKQSLDWVFAGAPTCMIARLAAGTSSAKQTEARAA